MRVEVVNLRKEFKNLVAVDDISFAFESGQIFGFVGPNGAGKTSAMRILATIFEPTSGDAYMDGVSVKEEPEKIRRVMGFMPDSLPMNKDITVHEYLDFFSRAYGLKGAERHKTVEGIEEFTNLIVIRDKLLKDLSKGMKQRVSLGRALIHNPSVLILDEPAAGLDPRARIELRELLKMLVEQGKAILISSHILSELTEICNGVIIIEQGKILETGTIKDVLTRTSPKRSVIIRPLEKLQELHKEVLQMRNVHSVQCGNSELRIEVDGSEGNVSDILTDLIMRKYRIVEYRYQENDLEDIFMKVTVGGVQ